MEKMDKSKMDKMHKDMHVDKKAAATAPVRLDRNVKGQSKTGMGNKGIYK